MFQKLYKHLEDLNITAKRQEEGFSESRQWGSKISGQLEDIKLLFQKNPQRRSWPMLSVFGMVLAGAMIGVLLLLFISIRDIRGNTQVALDRSAANGQESLLLFSHLSKAGDKQRNLEAEIARLDSLVQIQAQTIVELRKLNETAVRTFVYIRNDLRNMKRNELANEKTLK